MLTEGKFYEKAEGFALLKNTANEYFVLEKYQAKVKPNQFGDILCANHFFMFGACNIKKKYVSS